MSKCWHWHLHVGFLILWFNGRVLPAYFRLYGICLIYFVHLIRFIVIPFPLHRVYCLTILTMHSSSPRHVDVRSWQPPRKRFNSISLMHCHCQLGLFLVNFSSSVIIREFHIVHSWRWRFFILFHSSADSFCRCQSSSLILSCSSIKRNVGFLSRVNILSDETAVRSDNRYFKLKTKDK